MGLIQFFKMPKAIRRDVVTHYLNKIIHKRSSHEVMGSKNLFKLFRCIPGLEVKVEDAEYKLRLSENPGIEVYARKYPSSDLITLLEVWGKHEYQTSVKMLKSMKIQIPLILDVGGNVGYSTVYFKYYFPEAKIICIEPDQWNNQQILKNVELNNLNDISLVEGALWKKRSKMELKSDYRQGTSASFYVVESDKGTVEGYGINDIFSIQNWDHIDLLKMDIEGAEKYLFEDAQISSAILSKTRVVAIEIHDEKADRQKIYSALLSNGFKFYTRGETTFGINENF